MAQLVRWPEPQPVILVPPAAWFVTPPVTSTVQQGSAALSGSGALAATPAFTPSPALSGAGTLTASPALSASLTLSGSGSLTATPAFSPTVALSGAGTLTAAPSVGRLQLIIQGVTRPAPAPPQPPQLAGSPPLTIISRTAALDGQGTLTAQGTLGVQAALSGSGALTALPTLAASAALSGAGDLTAIWTLPGAGPVPAQGSFSWVSPFAPSVSTVEAGSGSSSSVHDGEPSSTVGSAATSVSSATDPNDGVSAVT